MSRRLIDQPLQLRGRQDDPHGRQDDDEESKVSTSKRFPRTLAEKILTNKDLLGHITSTQTGRKFKDWFDGDLAAKLGHLELMKMHDNLSYTENAIDWAAGNGNLEIVKYLFAKGLICTEKAMNDAAGNGHLEVLMWFRENTQETCTEKAYELAAKNGHLHILSWLYENNYRDCSYEAFTLAVQSGKFEILQWLFEHFPSQKFTTKIFMNLIDVAAMAGHLEIVLWLMDKIRALPRARGNMTGIFKIVGNHAARYGKSNIIEFLYEQQYQPTALNATMAIHGGQLAMLQEFCRRGVVMTNKHFEAAVNFNQLEIAQWLHLEKNLGHPPMPDLLDEIDFVNFELLSWLVDDLNHVLPVNRQFMSDVIKSGNYPMTKWLAETQNFELRYDSLLYAAESGNILLFEYLLERVPALNATQYVSRAMKSGQTAILTGVNTIDLSPGRMADWLIMKGYPLGSVENAAETNNLEFLKKVLASGAKIETIQPLSNAITANNFDMVKLLVEKYKILQLFPEDTGDITKNPPPGGNLAMFKYLHQHGVKFTENDFMNALSNRCLVIAQFIYSQLEITDWNDYSELPAELNHLAMAKWIFETFNYKPTFEMLEIAMASGGYTLPKWLYLKAELASKHEELIECATENQAFTLADWFAKHSSGTRRSSKRPDGSSKRP